MDFVYFKIVLLVNSWILANGIPVTMLQHPTSSQSIIFHPIQQDMPAQSTSTQKDVYNESDKQPKYEYKYEVSDYQTGDRKSHWEKRDGDTVKGAYSFYELDGSLRTVEYSADSHRGFNAVVKRTPSSNLHYTHEAYKTSSQQNNLTDGRVSNIYSSSTEDTVLSNANSDFRYNSINNTTGTSIGYTINHSIIKKNELRKLY